mmetsp:Transcript_18467/g.51350  ORF Transcript_18467/g.51350 Transcript_18467/m.51350 type:complete len:1107 (-) Transcript_18467:24-3344(-)
MSAGADAIANAVQVLEHYISGEVAEANALSQLLHLHQTNDKCVVAALAEKTNTVIANADKGSAAAAEAGNLLVGVARHLDTNAEAEVPAGASKAAKAAGAKAAATKAAAKSVSRHLLDHVLILTGGQNRAAKDNAIRAQGCSLVADLVLAVPGHQKAQEKLLEFASDRLPSIRERAVRGLGHVTSTPAVEQTLCARSGDPFMAVRSSAVRSMHVSSGTAAALIKRIDDVEACVRAELFRTLAREPAGGKQFGPAAFGRLCVGLTDRASAVRSAAGQAVDAWHKFFGSATAVLARCDVQGDEVLGDAVAGALAARFKEEGIAAVKAVLSGSVKGDTNGIDEVCTALLARHAVTVMREDDRDELIDAPLLLQRTNEALGSSVTKPHGAFVLRQLLYIVAFVDFCDESSRRRAERLAEATLQRAPLTTTSVAPSANVLTMADLGILIMRKCAGLCKFQPRSAKIQALEAQCSARGVLLISDLCQPLQGAPEADASGSGDDEAGEGQFATRLSNRLQELNDAIEERLQRRTAFVAQKKKAIANEEFIQAQRIKEATTKNDTELTHLEKEHLQLKAERDGILLRVLAIIRSMLRWSGSDLQKDPALFGTLERIMRPVVSLPALSENVEVAAIAAISTFCVRDVVSAQTHWSLFLELMRAIRPENQPPMDSKYKQHLKNRSAVVASALADCALVHSGSNGLDRDEIMSAAHALGAVPFYARHVAVEPLCRWLLGLGHVFFEEHLREPVLELQWALGWMLVEAFKQTSQDLDDVDVEEEQRAPRAVATPANASHAAAATKATRQRGTSWVQRPALEPVPMEGEKTAEDEEEEDHAEAMATASKLMQFFGLLPKLPGKHSAPMLSLAVESIAETGLWRRSVLLPHMVGGKARWRRGFSWPQLFNFAHERLAADMRFRLWRCALQLCISDPALATYAEVPFALVQVMKDAPAGAAGLVREAVALGADAAALSPLVSRLPPSEKTKESTDGLLPRAEAKAAEKERRAQLAELGINCDSWAPAEVQTPDIMPAHHRMKLAKGDKGGSAAAKKRGADAGPIVPPSLYQASAPAPQVPQQQQPAQAGDAGGAGAKRRRCLSKTKDEATAHLPLRDADLD